MNDSFVWFSDDDVEIVGRHYCSYCRQPMDEDEVPLLLFRGEDADCQIAQFHWEPCANDLIRRGIIKLASPEAHRG